MDTLNEKAFNPWLIDNHEDTPDFADPLIVAETRKRQAALWEITRSLQNITWAGTGSRQELDELEENMRALIDEKQHGYKYIESYLMAIGYGRDKIRMVFKRLTGADPEQFLNYDAYTTTPSAIPGFNYGWGASKDKTYDYYFIMPWKCGYAVFGQKGDIVRDEVKYVLSLQEALDFVEKKVKELQTYDRIVDIKKYAKPTENRAPAVETLALGDKSAAIKQRLDATPFVQSSEIRSTLEMAREAGDISNADFTTLAKHYGLIRYADTAPDLLDAADINIEKEIDERSPQQFFDNAALATGDLSGVLLGDVIEAAMKYIETVQADVAGYTLKVPSFKFLKQERSERIQKTPEVGTKKVEEFFDRDGILSVLIDIYADEQGGLKKSGLVVFGLDNGSLVTPGTFKGENGNVYGLNDAGISQYFTRAEK